MQNAANNVAAFAHRPGRTRCEAERGSAAGRPQLHLQSPVLEFGARHPILYHLVPFCPILYRLTAPFIPSCPVLYHPVPCSWSANGLQERGAAQAQVPHETPTLVVGAKHTCAHVAS